MSTRTKLPGGWYAEHRDDGIAIGHRDGGLHMAGLFEVSMVHEIERMRALLERVEVAMAAAEWAGIPGRWSEVHDEVRAALKEQR